MDESKLSPIGQANLKGVREGQKVYRGFSETCKEAMAINTALLMKILEDNKDTEYGRKYGFGEIKTVEEYQKRVPLITYDDIKEYTYRMTEKGEENLLTAYPVIHISKTSGTTGEPKRIPFTSEMAKVHSKYGIAYQDGLLGDKIGLEWVDGKKISLLEAGITILPSGHTFGSFSGKTILDCRDSLGYLFTSPAEAMIPDKTTETRYLYARYALMEENVTGAFCVTYSFVVEFMRYIEKNWRMLVRDIAEGTIDRSIHMTDEVRAGLEAKLAAMPERAAQLEKIFEQGFDEPVAPKIWPRLEYLVGVGTGGFSIYSEMLRKRYLGETIHQYHCGLFASEGHFSVPLDVDSNESVVIADSLFYEFLPLGEDDASKCVTLDQVQVGQCYEIVCTNVSGLYRYRMQEAVKVVGWYYGAPKIEFLYRINQTISMMGEKTTEVAMAHAVTVTVQKLELGMEDFSVYPNPNADPLCYQIFMEIDELLEGMCIEDIRKELEKNLSRANPSYGDKVARAILGKAQLYLLPPGTYQRYREKRVLEGASAMQMKPPHVLINAEQVAFFTQAAKEVQANDAL